MEREDIQQENTPITTENTPQQAAKPSDLINFKAITQNYLRHWYWFLISLVICGALGVFYMKKKSPVYSVQSTVLFNQDDEQANFSGLSQLASQFGFGGGNAGSVNLEDEMARLSSQKLLSEVVAKTKQNHYIWSDKGFFRTKEFYGDIADAPFRIDVPQSVLDTISVTTKFVITSSKDGSVTISAVQNKKKVFDKEISKFPFTAKTPCATFLIDTTSSWHKGMEVEFHDLIVSTPIAVEDIRSCFGIEEVDKKGNGITLYFETSNPQRGEFFVNTIIETYTDNRFNAQLQKRKEALAFVEERLLILYSELEESESEIESFKRKNKIVDAQAEAEYLFTKKGTIEAAATQTRAELEIYKMMRDALTTPTEKYSLLPYASGDSESNGNALGSAVAAYNELILQRMQLESGVKGQNAALTRLEDQISALRENILKSLSKEIDAKKIALSTVQHENNLSDGRFTEIPHIEKRLTQLYRDREVKNYIYAYLLQKREEAEIDVKQVRPISEVIDPAFTGVKPLSPKGMVVYSIALFFGLVIPLVAINIFCKSKKKRDDEDSHETGYAD